MLCGALKKNTTLKHSYHVILNSDVSSFACVRDAAFCYVVEEEESHLHLAVLGVSSKPHAYRLISLAAKFSKDACMEQVLPWDCRNELGKGLL